MKYFRSLARRACVLIVWIALFCLIDIRASDGNGIASPWTEASMDTTHLVESSGSPLFSLDSSKTSHSPSPLVNQHALLQVHVSVGCFLEENSIRHDSHQDLGSDVAERVLAMDTSWFIMITELPHSNIPIDSSIHLDQSVDLTWQEDSLQGNASLSFLVPLVETSGERTLIVSLMEQHVESSSSRIAARRLANLPVPPSSTGTIKKKTNAPTNPVVEVNLSTYTTCTTKAKKNDSTSTPTFVKAFYTLMIVVVGIAAFVYPTQSVAGHVDQDVEQEQAEQELEQDESLDHQEEQEVPMKNEWLSDTQESVSPARLKRTIVIDSPSSSSEDHSGRNYIAAPPQQADSFDEQDSCQQKSQIIKPPSLVRIPYSFVAEQEQEATSTLSVDDDAVEHQQSMVDSRRGDAFPSPVVDSNKVVANTTKGVEIDVEQIEATGVEGREHVAARAGEGNSNVVAPGLQDNAFPSPVLDGNTAPVAGSMSLTSNDLYRTPMIVDQGGSGERESEACNPLEKDSAHQQPTETHGTGGLSKANASADEEEIPLDRDGEDDASGRPSAWLGESACEGGRQDESRDASARAIQPVPRQLLQTMGPSLETCRGLENSNDDTRHLEGADRPAQKQTTTERTVAEQENVVEVGTLPAKKASVGEGAVELTSTQSPADDQEPQVKETPTPAHEKNNSPTVDSGQEARKALQSQVLDVEYVSVDESNWLRRLRDCPAAIQSSSLPPTEQPTANDPSREAQVPNDPEAEATNEVFSYVSTLPPDSDDDFPFDSTPIVVRDLASAPNENRTEAAAIGTSQGVSRPARRKRRLELLKTRSNFDQDQSLEKFTPAPSGRHDKIRPTTPKTSMTNESPAHSPFRAANPSQPSKPRPKKSPADTIVPDVVPSVFLQSVATQIAAPVPWDFTKTSSRPVVVKKEKQSRRRKRKGPPSTIELLNASPVPPRNQNSIVSRGSSTRRVHSSSKPSLGLAGEKRGSLEQSGKRRRLKK